MHTVKTSINCFSEELWFLSFTHRMTSRCQEVRALPAACSYHKTVSLFSARSLLQRTGQFTKCISPSATTSCDQPPPTLSQSHCKPNSPKTHWNRPQFCQISVSICLSELINWGMERWRDEHRRLTELQSVRVSLGQLVHQLVLLIL